MIWKEERILFKFPRGRAKYVFVDHLFTRRRKRDFYKFFPIESIFLDCVFYQKEKIRDFYNAFEGED